MILRKGASRKKLPEPVSQIVSVSLFMRGAWYAVRQVEWMKLKALAPLRGVPVYFYCFQGKYSTEITFYPKADRQYKVRIQYIPAMKEI
jgi:hypothetical protein